MLTRVRRSVLKIEIEAVKSNLRTRLLIRKLLRARFKIQLALRMWWLFWGLIVLTLVAGALLGMLPPLWAMVGSAGLWLVQHFFLNRFLDRYFLSYKRRALTRLARLWAHCRARLLADDLTPWISARAADEAADEYSE